MDAVIVGGRQGRGVAPKLKVFLSGSFRSVARGSFDNNARMENASEVGDAKEKDEEHRQDEGELDE
ncbi:MAG: hypothetical protein ACT4OQ_13175 [Chloroflexota bacterium]